MTLRIDLNWIDGRLALSSNGSNKTICKNERLLVPTTDLWYPYFLVSNGADSIYYPDSFEKFPSILQSNGKVMWRSAFNLALSCSLNVFYFPFGIDPIYRKSDVFLNFEFLL